MNVLARIPTPILALADLRRRATALVQTDVVVTDRNDRILTDLKLSDFEIYEKGKKQDLKFMEFVSERRRLDSTTKKGRCFRESNAQFYRPGVNRLKG